MMFNDTVTIFNRMDNIWYATVLNGVESQEVAAQSNSKDGNVTENQCNLHIPEGLMKEYVKPMQWNGEGYTIRCGDFFMIGEYDKDSINDDDYTVGFQDHMKNNYDSVYQIASVSLFKAIKHIEVVGK